MQMYKVLIIFLFSILLFTVFSCEGKKSEAEYFEQAYSLYNQEQYDESIKNFQKIIDYYPEGQNSPKATFMIGYIYANNTKNFEEAKKYYQLFIDKYPTHDLADDAQYELETLGQDINDLPIFKEVESRQEQVKN